MAVLRSSKTAEAEAADFSEDLEGTAAEGF